MPEQESESGENRANDRRPAEYGASPMECEATRLMTAAKCGDPRAFDDLVRSLRTRAYRVAQSLVGSHDDALELTQEAFLKTYRARATFREGEAFLPWFHRILRNTCFSFLRKHRRLKRHSLSGGSEDDEGEWQIEGYEPAPSLGAERQEAVRAFQAGFELLSARDREILALRHFEELSYREIADALSIPEGTVMSRLFHARRRLRERLKPFLQDALEEYAGEAVEITRGNR